MLGKIQYYQKRPVKKLPVREMVFKKNVGALHANIKTGISIDLTTDCPKRRAGNPCSYCYVEASRKIGYTPKKVIDSCPYNGEILNFSRDKVDFLNQCGGVRMFSFGDYMTEHRDTIGRILDDCEYVGLKVKAITKVPDFVKHFHDHPALRVVNISVDNTGDGVDWKTAKRLRKRYAKVRIRSAIMRPDDVKALAFCDVFTFNHALGLKSLGYRTFSKIEKTNYFTSLGGKVCCSTGKCFTCPLKCGTA
jgi:hypothetical protein